MNYVFANYMYFMCQFCRSIFLLILLFSLLHSFGRSPRLRLTSPFLDWNWLIQLRWPSRDFTSFAFISIHLFFCRFCRLWFQIAKHLDTALLANYLIQLNENGAATTCVTTFSATIKILYESELRWITIPCYILTSCMPFCSSFQSRIRIKF